MEGQNTPTAPGNGRPEDQDNVNYLEQIIQACKDSPGYVLFAAVLSKEIDPATKTNKINNFYRRYQFNYEDVRNSITQFEEAFKNDVIGLA